MAGVVKKLNEIVPQRATNVCFFSFLVDEQFFCSFNTSCNGSV